MFTIIIFGIIGLCIAIFFCSDLSYMYDIIFHGVFGLLFGVLLGIIIAILLPTKTETSKITYKIEALQDNNSVSGSFFLGSGNIKGDMKYVFYYEDNGYYKLKQIRCNNASIKYSDETPKVEKYDIVPVKDAFINNFSIYICTVSKYIIYVPNGSIKQNYTLDAQ